jgi:hypothetical protein
MCASSAKQSFELNRGQHVKPGPSPSLLPALSSEQEPGTSADGSELLTDHDEAGELLVA